MPESRQPTPDEIVTKNNAEAVRLSLAITGIARQIPQDQKDKYGIPTVIDIRALRNAIANQNNGKIQEQDEKHIEIAWNVAKWTIDRLPRPNQI